MSNIRQMLLGQIKSKKNEMGGLVARMGEEWHTKLKRKR
jgi:hypothetical protein